MKKREQLSLNDIVGVGSGRPTQPAIVLAGKRDYRVLDVSQPPKPGPGEVVVQCKKVGVCGTDFASWRDEFELAGFPIRGGHEGAGEVVALGEGVEGLKVGAKAAFSPFVPGCESFLGYKCRACDRERWGACKGNATRGVMHQVEGFWQPFTTIRADRVHPHPTLGLEHLALTEPLTIGHRAVVQSIGHFPEEGEKPLEGQHVVVVGSGTIGLAAATSAQFYGATVVVADLEEPRLKAAGRVLDADKLITLNFGATADDNVKMIQEATGEQELPEFVIDATGSHRSMAAAYTYVGTLGTLVFVGIAHQPVSFKHPPFHMLEAAQKCSRNSDPRDFTRVHKIMEGIPPVKLNAWIGRRLTFNNFVEQFPDLSEDKTCLKGMVSVPENIEWFGGE